jgi:hypothetical protein
MNFIIHIFDLFLTPKHYLGTVYSFTPTPYGMKIKPRAIVLNFSKNLK